MYVLCVYAASHFTQAYYIFNGRGNLAEMGRMTTGYNRFPG